jgi:hypothetical protein
MSTSGQTWLKAFENAKEPWFNYFAEYGFTHDQDTWMSNLSIPAAQHRPVRRPPRQRRGHLPPSDTSPGGAR